MHRKDIGDVLHGPQRASADNDRKDLQHGERDRGAHADEQISLGQSRVFHAADVKAASGVEADADGNRDKPAQQAIERRLSLELLIWQECHKHETGDQHIGREAEEQGETPLIALKIRT